jgi:formylmethanofuran dehydrogenase subunit D
VEALKMEMILNTIRKVDNDQNKEFAFGDINSLEEHLAIAFLNPKEYAKLNLTREKHLKISNNIGSIIVNVVDDENVPEGSILLPVSIWANRITIVEKGELHFKNIKVAIEVTTNPISKYSDIIKQIKGA